jgi:hypothetical protein
VKKLVIIVLFNILIVATALAGTIGVGASFGANATWATGQGWSDQMDLFDDISTISSVGFRGGVYLVYEFNNHFALQLEALAASNGWAAEGTDTGDELLIEYYFFGIEAPVMAKGMLPFWRGSAYAVAGPVFFFPLFNLAFHEERNGVETASSETAIETTFHVGVTGGLGYEIYLKKWCFGFDVRCIQTFKGLLDQQYFDQSYLNTLAFKLSAGKRFYNSRGRQLAQSYFPRGESSSLSVQGC